MLALYRSAREVYSVCQDLRQLYEIAVEYTRRPEASQAEIELITAFRECEPAHYDADPLLEGPAEPWDSGWSLLSSASTPSLTCRPVSPSKVGV